MWWLTLVYNIHSPEDEQLVHEALLTATHTDPYYRILIQNIKHIHITYIILPIDRIHVIRTIFITFHLLYTMFFI